MNNILCKINTREKFREWLKENSKKEKECYLILKRGKPDNKKCFYYIDAVEEALCFGWIDSVTPMIDGIRMQRFSPRAKNSPWTELNKTRARRLIRLGLMESEGKKVLPKLTRYKLPVYFIEDLKTNRVYSKYKKFPPLYQRIRAFNICQYKKTDNQQYVKSLNNLIKYTKQGKMFGEWNDYGRLLDNE